MVSVPSPAMTSTDRLAIVAGDALRLDDGPAARVQAQQRLAQLAFSRLQDVGHVDEQHLADHLPAPGQHGLLLGREVFQK